MADRLVCVADYERYAEETLPKVYREYFNSGANYEQTYRDNVEAFKRYRFLPRYMVDVSRLDLSTSLLGQSVDSPIGVSPIAMCRLAHPDGEVALAKACEAERCLLTLSMSATASLEEVGQAAPAGPRWFQVHVLRDRDMLTRMIARAERAGYGAIVVTVDCAVHGRRYKDLRNQFHLPPHLKIANFEEELQKAKSTTNAATANLEWGQFVNHAFSPAHTWEDIRWLKTITSLPVVCKGVVTGRDADEALKVGADAIWVSNHGGRELDCLPAAIDALGEVARTVGGRAEVYVDGGVRCGLDVLKALSRGARAVFCGRPALWGLVHKGSQGTRDVLCLLNEELRVGMSLAGVTDVKAVPEDLVVHETAYLSRL